MSPGSGPLTIPATGPKARVAWSGRVSDPPLRLFQPLDGVPGHRVSLVIGCPWSSGVPSSQTTAL